MNDMFIFGEIHHYCSIVDDRYDDNIQKEKG